MGRNRLRVLALTIALCAAAPSTVAAQAWVRWGNDTGGIIPWSPEAELVALSTAMAHCGRFYKYPRITSITRMIGDYIAFACTFDPPGATAVMRQRSVVVRVRG